MINFETKRDAIDYLTDAIKERGEAAGFKFYFKGMSEVSCSTYVSLYRENDETFEAQDLEIRISDHPMYVDRCKNPDAVHQIRVQDQMDTGELDALAVLAVEAAKNCEWE